MKKLKLGLVGLSCRGIGLLMPVILPRENVEVVAVCDLYPDRVKDAAKKIVEAGKSAPAEYLDYHDLIADENVEAVIVATAWESHVDIACACMEAGKSVAVEVGGAYSIDDCFRLVRTYERTGTLCMMLENCCYGKYELMALNMIKKGLFGEIVHLSGGYHHDLRDEVSLGRENRHYRFRNYLSRNCENYPTHELGPIAKSININDGNRMLYLTSTSSKSVGLHEFIKSDERCDKELLNKEFKQGDIVTTVIKCANGETIVLTLDTTLPRYYTRGFSVRGTKGMYEEVTNSVFLDSKNRDNHFDWNKHWGNAAEYLKDYEHPIWERYEKEGVTGGHDGIDWLVVGAFIDAVLNGYDAPIDVYDMASWMSVTALSEESIACGSKPVAIPDFTNGKWLIRERNISPEYDLYAGL